MNRLLVLALLFFTGIVQAQTCPEGQTMQWVVTQKTNNGASTPECIVGTTAFQQYQEAEVCSTGGPWDVTDTTTYSRMYVPSGPPNPVYTQSQPTKANVKRWYDTVQTNKVTGAVSRTNRVALHTTDLTYRCHTAPPQSNCEALLGKKKSMAVNQFTTGNVCNPNNQCVLTFASGDKTFRQYGTAGGTLVQQGTYSGGQCDQEEETEEPTCGPDEFCPQPETPCGTLGGDTACVSENETNCGTVNGQPFCAGQGPENGSCVTTAGGNMVCIEPGADLDDKPATPPAPNTGTQGQPAQPDGAVKNPTTGTTVHVYGAGTVNGSTHKLGNGQCDAGEEATPDCQTHDGDGQCEAGEEDTPDCAEPEGECDPQTEECGPGSGDGKVKGKGGSAKSYRESAEAFISTVQGSGIGAAVSGIGQGMPAGECPPISMNVLGAQIGTDAHCVLAGELGALSLLFLGIWGVLAVRILMSA